MGSGEEIIWNETGDAEFPYEARVGGKHLKIRLNDFPDEPLYTLLVDDVATRHFDDWPATWKKTSSAALGEGAAFAPLPKPALC